MLAAGSFNGWLILQPISDAIGEVGPIADEALDAGRRDVHPCAATTWIAVGELWSAERARARIARVHMLRTILLDHQRGIAVLDEHALQVAEAMSADDVAFDTKFETARDQLQRAIVGLRVESYAADFGRTLVAADFASPIWLDVLAGKFVAGPAAMVLSQDWERASAACKRIGAVRVPAGALIKVFARRRANSTSRKRAAEVLRELFERWRRGEAPMPKRADWENGRGAHIVGTVRAAGMVWREVASYPAYAAARQAGRRRAAKIEDT